MNSLSKFLTSNEDKEDVAIKIYGGKLSYSNLSSDDKNDKEFLFEVIKNSANLNLTRNMSLYSFILEMIKDFEDDFEFMKVACLHSEVIRHIPKKYIENKDFFIELVDLNNTNINYSEGLYKKDKDIFHKAVAKNSAALSYFDESLMNDPQEHEFLLKSRVSLKIMPEKYRKSWVLAKPFCIANPLNKFLIDFNDITSEDEIVEIVKFSSVLYQNIKKHKDSMRVIKATIENEKKYFYCLYNMPIKMFDDKENLNILLNFLKNNGFFEGGYEQSYKRLKPLFSLKECTKYIKKENLKDDYIEKNCIDELEKWMLMYEKELMESSNFKNVSPNKPKLTVRKF